jgi:hypothetical protein
MHVFALCNSGGVIARIDRSCSINGRAFTVEPGQTLPQRQYVALSVGILRYINHSHPGLLFQVATTPDEAERYPAPALVLDADALPVVVAD